MSVLHVKMNNNGKIRAQLERCKQRIVSQEYHAKVTFTLLIPCPNHTFKKPLLPIPLPYSPFAWQWISFVEMPGKFPTYGSSSFRSIHAVHYWTTTAFCSRTKAAQILINVHARLCKKNRASSPLLCVL